MAKREKILAAALKLFAEDGYTSTPTSKVAKVAGVSEGLIFRHFTNKEGLLLAIVEEGYQRLGSTFIDIISEEDPGKRLSRTIELPFTLVKAEHTFWKLQFALKWQNPGLYQRISLEPLTQSVTDAFEALNYKDPELETQLLMMIIDGLASALLKGNVKKEKAIMDFIKLKYEV